MSKEIYISSTPHETRLAIVEKDELSEIYYERENEYTLAGSIYNGRVTRVLPGMQSAFVDVGLERDAFLYITDFMEEQEDSAEFESGDARRGAERNGGERNGDRQRNGEQRGRGERDRNGRGREESREVSGEAPGHTEAVAEPVERHKAPEEVSAEGGDEGAEGSRRWRGRRGRRRGRGAENQPVATTTTEQTPTVLEDEEFAAAQGDPEPEALGAVYGEAQAETRTREPRGREDRGGRDRGGRNREGRDRGGRGERFGGREAAADAGPELAGGTEPLILPGESLSRYRRGAEGGASAESASVQPARPQANLVSARPSTEIDLTVAGWDGGFTLPGETLSRHRGRAEARPAEQQEERAPETAAQAADEAAGGRNRRRDRDKRRGRGDSPSREQGAGTQAAEEPTPTSYSSGVATPEALEPIDAVQPGVSSQHHTEDADVPFGQGIVDLGPAQNQADAEGAATPDVFYEAETDAAPANQGPSPAALRAAEELHEVLAAAPVPVTTHAPVEFQEETHEYEPGEDASASYRVDPAGPSEFRQSSVTEDDDVEPGDPEVQADYAGREHQYTTLESNGEMLSELPGEIAAAVPDEDPTNPIEHETAVLSSRLADVDGSLELTQPAEAGASTETEEPAATFAPGDGQLEEELLDEEDETGALDLAASYNDDTEEETFEAGAAIGIFARERALDQITGSSAALLDDDEDEDEFDIDEEEMEEDELESSEELGAADIADAEEDAVLDHGEGDFDESDKPAAATMGEFPEFAEEPGQREPRRERSGGGDRGREFRRGGRDRGGNRDRRGMANSRSGGRQSRHSVQNTDLPAISDLLKPGQEVLVQIAKEPIAKKGARITSHIALPGRFLVFMPTVNHVGVSRKIESDGERRRLKEILLSEKGEATGGFIVRTAAMGASEEELRSDLRFLLNLWADIKQRSDSSKSPALIYHDLNLVERILRDQVTDNFSAIWVDTETEYERVLRFLQRFQPSLMRRVKLYSKDTPLFEQFGISEEINKALRSKVWLKSGGSIVINQTEALVAIDINTGKYVGKTARLEDTIVKTNLDAIPEIVRQIRLRDLGGIIVIDFIDMDDRKNRQKVLTALEEELKNDRAPSKVLQFNDFGLVAITRKRVKQSLERTLSTTCGICAGTGMVKSPVTVCNEIYIELRKMHKQLDKGDVMLRVNPEVVKQLKSGNGKWLQEMEEISGKTILVKSDPSLHPEQFDIH